MTPTDLDRQPPEPLTRDRPTRLARIRKRRRPRTPAGPVIELVVIVAVALGLALGIQAFIVKPYKIPTGSMEPTLAVGQRVLVDRIGNALGEPHVGEIVVFHPPANAEEGECGSDSHPVTPGGAACDEPDSARSSTNFIKRIVAGPGDEIYIREGHVYRRAGGRGEFVREKDPYIKACYGSSECNFPRAIRIPTGHWFMMGDNRGNSDDSRFWGPVPTSWIIGEAFVTYWPPDRIGTL